MSDETTVEIVPIRDADDATNRQVQAKRKREAARQTLESLESSSAADRLRQLTAILRWPVARRIGGVFPSVTSILWRLLRLSVVIPFGLFVIYAVSRLPAYMQEKLVLLMFLIISVLPLAEVVTFFEHLMGTLALFAGVGLILHQCLWVTDTYTTRPAVEMSRVTALGDGPVRLTAGGRSDRGRTYSRTLEDNAPSEMAIRRLGSQRADMVPPTALVRTEADGPETAVIDAAARNPEETVKYLRLTVKRSSSVEDIELDERDPSEGADLLRAVISQFGRDRTRSNAAVDIVVSNRLIDATEYRFRHPDEPARDRAGKLAVIAVAAGPIGRVQAELEKLRDKYRSALLESQGGLEFESTIETIGPTDSLHPELTKMNVRSPSPFRWPFDGDPSLLTVGAGRLTQVVPIPAVTDDIRPYLTTRSREAVGDATPNANLDAFRADGPAAAASAADVATEATDEAAVSDAATTTEADRGHLATLWAWLRWW